MGIYRNWLWCSELGSFRFFEGVDLKQRCQSFPLGFSDRSDQALRIQDAMLQQCFYFNLADRSYGLAIDVGVIKFHVRE